MEGRLVDLPARPADIDVVALAQLWADQFQHMTTLAVAGAGGLLLMLQSNLVRVGNRWWVAMILMASAAMLGMIGQATVVDEATKGVPPGRGPRVIRGLALMAFGAGAYGVVKLFV
jgi:hypothetical protein